MKTQQRIAGIIVATSIPLFVLPARISEGQWSDPVNLIGSEIVIFFMCLACWYSIISIQQKHWLLIWKRLALSVIACCVLSNLFYFTFNPFFKDFPFRTPHKSLWVSVLMLSSRGILMSVILIPAAHYLQKDLEAKKARKAHAELAMEKVQIQNRLLEQAVLERTQALQQALTSLENSQHELGNQLYIQSRLVASITHDIRAPFHFLVRISAEIARLARVQDYAPIHNYAVELKKSQENMLTYIENLLEFTKLPVQQKVARSEEVSLARLVKQKAQLFDGIIRTYHNELLFDLDEAFSVESNYNLVGIILHNLIDNANRYTVRGQIKVSAAVRDSAIHLTVQNPGKNIAAPLVEWMNSTNHAIDPKTVVDTNQVQGIGLVLVKEIANLLEIGLLMESDEEITKVHLIFRKYKIHEHEAPVTPSSQAKHLSVKSVV